MLRQARPAREDPISTDPSRPSPTAPRRPGPATPSAGCRLRRLAAALALALTVVAGAGCKTRPYELGYVPDLTVPPPDFTVPPDLTVIPDFTPPPDLVPPFFCRPIYTVDANSRRLYGFDPDTVTFNEVGLLNCPGAAGKSLDTMSIDLSGNAWVFYSDGSIYLVDLLTAKCAATAFDPGNINPDKNNMQQTFGSSFSLNGPNTAEETLWVSLGNDLQLLGIDPVTLKATRGAALPDECELTGTPEGELWMFAPGAVPATYIARIDKVSGAIDSKITIPQITVRGNFAFAYWGGSFWIFNGDGQQGAGGAQMTNVYRVDRNTGVAEKMNKSATNRFIVGAGISGCAPGARDI